MTGDFYRTFFTFSNGSLFMLKRLYACLNFFLFDLHILREKAYRLICSGKHFVLILEEDVCYYKWLGNFNFLLVGKNVRGILDFGHFIFYGKNCIRAFSVFFCVITEFFVTHLTGLPYRLISIFQCMLNSKVCFWRIIFSSRKTARYES